METTTVWPLLVISLMWMPCAHSASFDCAKAKTKVEKLICANPRLSELDEKVSALYKKVLEQSPVPEDSKEQQREWIKRDRNTCKDAACLERNYARRISDLEEDLKNLPFKPNLDKPLLVLPSTESPEDRDAEAKGGAAIVKKEPLELIGRVSEGHNEAGANFLILSGKKYYVIRYGWDLTDEQKDMLTKFEGNQYVLLKGQLLTYKDGSKVIDRDSEVQIFAQAP
jgi:uncharacterized protein